MKKRILLLLGTVIVLSAQVAMGQVAKVTLSHYGQLTMYNAEELQSAINASVAGDTIFLNEGSFSGGITIPKAISLIGAGENTIINGNVNITASGTFTARMLDALNIQGSISGGSSTGLVIRKCKFYGFSCGSLVDAVIDRCYCYGYGSNSYIYLNSNIKNMQVVNSVVRQLRNYASNVGDVTFVNCNILSFNTSDNVKATFLNCIVRNNYTQRDSYFSYCKLYQDNGTNTMQNCQTGSFSWSDTYNYSTSMLGTDGTVIGIKGGTTPFTLVPNNPKVINYNLNVDAVNKKLTVNVSVTAN